MKFGHLLGTHPGDRANFFDTVLVLAKESELVGLDAIFYSDHFQYQRHSFLVGVINRIIAALQRRQVIRTIPEQLKNGIDWITERERMNPARTLPVLECFTTLAAIAACTHKIRIGALVAGVPYRNPALLAKINTTLDLISHGRCIVGLGAGWDEAEFKAYGWPFPTKKQRLDGLEDAILIVDGMMTRSPASYAGPRYQIDNAINNPLPIQKPRPPFLIGGSGERRTLQIVAKYADYCNIFGDPATVARKLKVLQAYCETIGRPYESIIPSNFVSILIARDSAGLKRKRKIYHPWLGYPIIGTPEAVISELEAFHKAGVQYVIFNLPDAHQLDSLHLLAEMVVPSLSELH